MRRRIIVAALAIAVASLAAGTASAQLVGYVPRREPTPTGVEHAYTHAYHIAVDRFGLDLVGRNIVRDGIVHGNVAVPPSQHRVAVALRDLRTMLNPPPVPQPSGTATVAPTPAVYPGGGGGLPACTWAPESGGNYNAVNPTSGAYGKYQITPDHWSTGVCRGLGQDPSGQDQCAQRVLASEGPGAWVNC